MSVTERKADWRTESHDRRVGTAMLQEDDRAIVLFRVKDVGTIATPLGDDVITVDVDWYVVFGVNAHEVRENITLYDNNTVQALAPSVGGLVLARVETTAGVTNRGTTGRVVSLREVEDRIIHQSSHRKPLALAMGRNVGHIIRSSGSRCTA